jgi:hypothetical protein
MATTNITTRKRPAPRPAPPAPAEVGINVQIPADLHRRFKARAAIDGKTLTDAVAAALAAYLSKSAA